MNPGDIIELTENYSTTPARGKRVTLQRGQQFTVRGIIKLAPAFVGVTDGSGVKWQLPVAACEVVKKAESKVKA